MLFIIYRRRYDEQEHFIFIQNINVYIYNAIMIYQHIDYVGYEIQMKLNVHKPTSETLRLK